MLLPAPIPCRPQSEDDKQFVPQARLQVGSTDWLCPDRARPPVAAGSTVHIRQAFLSAALSFATTFSPFVPGGAWASASGMHSFNSALPLPAQFQQALVRQVGLGIGIQNAKATEDAEGALRAVAGDFISNAGEIAVVSWLCEACTSTAGRRRAEFSSSNASEPGRVPSACRVFVSSCL